MKVNKKKYYILINIIFAAIILFGISVLIEGLGDLDKGVEVKATIVGIEKDVKLNTSGQHISFNITHDVKVDYEYKGDKFGNVSYHYYKRGMKKGDVITIRLHENSPITMYYAERDIKTGITYILLGLFCVLRELYILKRKEYNEETEISM